MELVVAQESNHGDRLIVYISIMNLCELFFRDLFICERICVFASFNCLAYM